MVVVVGSSNSNSLINGLTKTFMQASKFTINSKLHHVHNYDHVEVVVVVEEVVVVIVAMLLVVVVAVLLVVVVAVSAA